MCKITVIKRDGRKVEYNPDRIKRAIIKASKACKIKIEDTVIDEMISSLDVHNDISVEEIQDMTVAALRNFGFAYIAGAYAQYRELRRTVREQKNKLMSEIGNKLLATNIENSNANMDEGSFGGRMGEAANTAAKEYALNYCMSEMSRDNHLNNEIYIHDLNSYAIGQPNCLTLPLSKMLSSVIKTRQTDIRPANSFSTAMQLLAVYFQIQSLQQFGGVAASSLDWDLVPYVRKSFYKHWLDGMKWLEGEQVTKINNPEDISIDDDSYMQHKRAYAYATEMLNREVEQSVEAMFHNLNSLQSRSGSQLPFSSINYGTCTLTEGRLVIRKLLEGAIKGVGPYHRTPIFPCCIFQVKSGINKEPGTKNYDLFKLALKCTAKRMYPNYANVDWSVNTGYDPNDPHTQVATMGCRTYNGLDINGLGQLKDGRGNICPVTIIMPTIAMEAIETLENKGSNELRIDAFIELLDKKINEAKDMLIERFNHICSQPKSAASFVYDNDIYARLPEDKTIRDILRHGTLAIGQIGLAETLQILIGQDHTTEYGMSVAKKIEGLFQRRCKEFKEQYKLNFGVYYSPAENLCYTSLLKFRDKYGIIKNVSDKEYFTNSIHVPVWKKYDPFTKIDIESELTGYSSAGCITYVELSSGVEHNLEALERIVIYGMDHDVPYLAINIPIDDCQSCGASGEFGETCPECGSDNIKRLRRVTGYLSTDYRHFNLGKQAEVLDRIKHMTFHTGETEVISNDSNS